MNPLTSVDNLLSISDQLSLELAPTNPRSSIRLNQ